MQVTSCAVRKIEPGDPRYPQVSLVSFNVSDVYLLEVSTDEGGFECPFFVQADRDMTLNYAASMFDVFATAIRRNGKSLAA